jgi:hypothetical protein
MGSGVRSDLNTLSPFICNISTIWNCDRKARDVITGAWWAGAFGGIWRFGMDKREAVILIIGHI